MPASSGAALRAALEEAARSGAGFVQRGVSARTVRDLLDEVGDGPFGAVESVVGSVRQQVESLEIRRRDFARFPVLRAFRDDLTASICEAGRGIRGLATWRP
ncbi:MAG: hypothetical protein LC722_01545, partial [Actinobacteria bacterium]|nr:hypothetical protein [Actinomycetota bacterium]